MLNAMLRLHVHIETLQNMAYTLDIHKDIFRTGISNDPGINCYDFLIT